MQLIFLAIVLIGVFVIRKSIASPRAHKAFVGSSLMIGLASVLCGSFSLAVGYKYERYEWFSTALRDYCMLHRWRHYGDSDIMIWICLGLVLSLAVVYFILRRSKGPKASRGASYLMAPMALFAIIVLYVFAWDCNGYKHGLNYMRIDGQLASEDPAKLHEALDTLAAHGAGCGWDEKCIAGIMAAADGGHAWAQYLVGDYYCHEAEWLDSLDARRTVCIDQATEWWRLSAEQNCGHAQFRLGLQCLNEELTNGLHSLEQAEYWMSEAAKNGAPGAYYYLGMMRKDTSFDDMLKYWRLGAEAGDWRCKRALKDPYSFMVDAP